MKSRYVIKLFLKIFASFYYKQLNFIYFLVDLLYATISFDYVINYFRISFSELFSLCCWVGNCLFG